MKKNLLLGTTSVVLAVSLTAPALAGEKIKLELGGKMEQYFGGIKTFSDGGRKASNGLGIDSDTEVYFRGRTTLDNGLTIRVNIEMEAEANDTNKNIDEQYVDVSGSFGMFRIGEKSGVFDINAVRAPNKGYVSQQDIIDWMKPARMATSPKTGDGWNYPDLEPTLDNDTLRLTYMTPQFYGFNLGVSYAPNAGIYNPGSPRVRDDRVNSNEVQVSIGFDRKFESGIGLRADGAFATTINGYDMYAYRGGLGITYAGFTLSGSYLGTSAAEENQGSRYLGNQAGLVCGSSCDGLNKGGFDINIWEVGASYETGPYAVEFVYAENSSSRGSGLGDARAYKVAGAYKLGPGITAVGNVFYAETDNKLNGKDHLRRDGIGVVSGLILNF